MIAVNAVTAVSSTGSERIDSTTVRWPVLEIGRNSVTPSTTPRRIASGWPIEAVTARSVAVRWQTFRAGYVDLVEQRFVGGSGLRVSRLGLGTLTWGRDTDEHEAADQLRDFLDAGGTLIDSAAAYGAGAAEE